MRARTSSLRLVSWVVVASMRCGQSRCALGLRRWKAATLMPKCSGSPPTSLSEISRL